MVKFDRLYSLSNTGKIKEWDIEVVDSTITISYGYANSKKVIAKTQIRKGKNIGKINETTTSQQATMEALSKWNKKLDSGYTKDIPETNNKKLPMLALDYIKRSQDIKFPCYVQPKIDGIRAIASKNLIYSRKGKHFNFLKEITMNIPEDILLDGEIFSDKLSFQELSGLVRKKTLDTKDIQNMKLVKFIVYDIADNTEKLEFKERLKILKEFFKNDNTEDKVELLKTEICKTKDEIPLFLKKYENSGYEGLIIRNTHGVYRMNQRSKDLQKLKSFTDEEYKIVGFTEGNGIEKGLVIWICETKEGKKFNVRPKGEHEERRKLFIDANKYIGKMLTVKFQELTNDGIPRFGTGVAIRDYE